MKKKIKRPKFDKDGYELHPFGKNAKAGKRVPDFLPPPGSLRFKNPEKIAHLMSENQRRQHGFAPQKAGDITITLPPKSLGYLKRRARREKTTPQALIAAFIQEHLPVR